MDYARQGLRELGFPEDVEIQLDEVEIEGTGEWGAVIGTEENGVIEVRYGEMIDMHIRASVKIPRPVEAVFVSVTVE